MKTRLALVLGLLFNVVLFPINPIYGQNQIPVKEALYSQYDDQRADGIVGLNFSVKYTTTYLPKEKRIRFRIIHTPITVDANQGYRYNGVVYKSEVEGLSEALNNVSVNTPTVTLGVWNNFLSPIMKKKIMLSYTAGGFAMSDEMYLDNIDETNWSRNRYSLSIIALHNVQYSGSYTWATFKNIIERHLTSNDKLQKFNTKLSEGVKFFNQKLYSNAKSSLNEAKSIYNTISVNDRKKINISEIDKHLNKIVETEQKELSDKEQSEQKKRDEKKLKEEKASNNETTQNEKTEKKEIEKEIEEEKKEVKKEETKKGEQAKKMSKWEIEYGLKKYQSQVYITKGDEFFKLGKLFYGKALIEYKKAEEILPSAYTKAKIDEINNAFAFENAVQKGMEKIDNTFNSLDEEGTTSFTFFQVSYGGFLPNTSKLGNSGHQIKELKLGLVGSFLFLNFEIGATYFTTPNIRYETARLSPSQTHYIPSNDEAWLSYEKIGGYMAGGLSIPIIPSKLMLYGNYKLTAGADLKVKYPTRFKESDKSLNWTKTSAVHHSINGGFHFVVFPKSGIGITGNYSINSFHSVGVDKQYAPEHIDFYRGSLQDENDKTVFLTKPVNAKTKYNYLSIGLTFLIN